MTAAGWYADPTGRHEHRYWDGARWTDDVADGGVAGQDPLVPQGDPFPAALDAGHAELVAALDRATVSEHPRVELSTAVSVAKAVLEILVVDPTRATAFGISFPGDEDGSRLRRASVLHERRHELDLASVVPALRALAFHVLMALPADAASRQACARALDEPDTVGDVAAALGEVFFAVFGPTQDERGLMQQLYSASPGLGWDVAYLEHLHGWLARTLLPQFDGTLPDDAANVLWGVTRGVVQPYALALFPDLAG